MTFEEEEWYQVVVCGECYPSYIWNKTETMEDILLRETVQDVLNIDDIVDDLIDLFGVEEGSPYVC